MEEVSPFLLRDIGADLEVLGVFELHLGANGKRTILGCDSALDGTVLIFALILLLSEDYAS